MSKSLFLMNHGNCTLILIMVTKLQILFHNNMCNYYPILITTVLIRLQMLLTNPKGNEDYIDIVSECKKCILDRFEVCRGYECDLSSDDFPE